MPTPSVPEQVSPSSLSVTLIDPFSGGHHVPYAVQVCRELQRRGVTVNLIGPDALVSGVLREVPLARHAALNLYAGPPSAYYARGKWHEERSSYLFTRRALRQARAWGSDVAHFVFLDSFVLSLLLARGAAGRMRVFTTLHWAYLLPRFREPGTWGLVRSRAQLLGLRALLHSGVQLQVHTASFASEFARHTGSSRVQYLPYPAEPMTRSSAQEVQAARAALGLAPGDRLLLAFGETRRNKGADVAIAALAQLPGTYHLLVMGAVQDFTAEDLTRLAERWGVAARVHLRLEFMPEGTFEPYFAAADVAVMPYLPSFSGQSGVMFMAGAAGLPVVATDAGSMAELVESFELGETVSAHGPLEVVAADLAMAVRQVAERPVPAPVREARRQVFMAAHSNEAFGERLVQEYRAAGGRSGTPRGTPLLVRERLNLP